MCSIATRKKYSFLETKIGTLPASEVDRIFSEVCGIVNTDDLTTPRGIEAHSLRQLCTAATVRIETLRLNFGNMEDAADAVEKKWAAGWGYIKPWSDDLNV